VRALIEWQVTDLLEHTRQRLRRHHVRTVADVRQAPETLVGLGPEVQALKVALEEFLHRAVYRHPRVMRMATKGRRFLRALFEEYCRAPMQLPERYRRRALDGQLERTVCDYLAGMTDRYAQNEYLRLFQPYTDV
jgi:dGTPase